MIVEAPLGTGVTMALPATGSPNLCLLPQHTH